MDSWCVESEKWVEIFFHHWTSKKIPFLYFFLHKSWIWRTLGHVMDIFSYCHFHIASKECFWPKKFSNYIQGFKSANLAIFWFTRIEKSFLFYVPMNHLNFWKGKLEAPTFFAIKTPRQAVWVPYDSRQLSKIPLSASLWGEVVKATIKLAYLYRPLSISTVSIWNDGKITPSTNKHGQVNAIIIWININWNWNYGVKYRS